MRLDKGVLALWSKGYSVMQICKRYGVTRHAVYKFLHKHNIEPNDREKAREYVTLTCACGVQYKMINSRIGKWGNSYCSPECYRKSQRTPEYNRNRQGQRIARKVLNRIFPVIGTDYVIHHIDGNPMNNDVGNLMVFLNQIGLMMWLDNGESSPIKPLWRGDNVIDKTILVHEESNQKFEDEEIEELYPDEPTIKNQEDIKRFIPPGLAGLS